MLNIEVNTEVEIIELHLFRHWTFFGLIFDISRAFCGSAFDIIKMIAI